MMAEECWREGEGLMIMMMISSVSPVPSGGRAGLSSALSNVLIAARFSMSDKPLTSGEATSLQIVRRRWRERVSKNHF